METKNEDEIELLNRLFELLQQADAEKHSSSLFLVYVAPGAQYVNNQYNQQPPSAPCRKREDANSKVTEEFNPDTPLSALFRESHHEELRQIIESWRPFLTNDEQSTDALKMNSFHFDFSKVIATHIYIDLGRLLHDHALADDNMNLLASYLYQHSNLSNSQSTLYAQLRKYKKR